MIAVNGLGQWGYMFAVAAGIAVVTVVTRGSFFVLPASVRTPAWLDRMFRFAPACAVAAVVAPSLFTVHGHLDLDLHREALWGALAGTLVFLKWRNMLAMMGAGLLVAAALRPLLAT